MKAVFITEGGQNFGFGHLARCSGLYHAFTQKGIDCEMLVEGDVGAETFLKGVHYKMLLWHKKERVLLKKLSDASFIVLDSYHASTNLIKFIAALNRTHIFFDDFQRVNYPGGIIVNPAGNKMYGKRENNDFLTGFQYISYRREFWQDVTKKINPGISDVLISYGGTDQSTLIKKTLTVLNNLIPHLKCHVIGHHAIKNEFKSSDGNRKIFFYSQLTPSKLLVLYRKCDIAVCNGGQTLLELARAGVPALVIITADNQQQNTLAATGKEFAVSYGSYPPFNENKLKFLIKKLDKRNVRKNMSFNARKIIDGKGSLRIASCAIKKHLQEKILLRKAGKNDMLPVFRLSNQPEIRRNSFNARRILLKNHTQWFSQIINDESVLFLMGYIENILAGQVRFNIKNVEATISISVDKRFRNFGAGSVLMEKSIQYLNVKYPYIKTILAFIKKNNPRSIRFFENNGFKFTRNLKIRKFPSVKYKFSI